VRFRDHLAGKYEFTSLSISANFWQYSFNATYTLAGAFDGHLRAYAANDGEIIWDYDTNRAFDSVSGDLAHGGSIESDGPVVAHGHVLVNSGYLFGGRMPGNVLLAFTAGDRP
jgi:outer membrane protein assembly factor BamB